jgi:hypothetical protein
VDDVISVEVIDCLKSLYEVFECFCLSEDPFGVLVIEEIALFCVFDDEVEHISIE